MENRKEETLGSLYGVDVEKYSFSLLSDCREASACFSDRTWNALRSNRIFFVSDLLNTPPDALLGQDGFSVEVVGEIRRFAESLEKLPAPEEPDAELEQLHGCRIALPLEIPFAQRYGIDAALFAGRDICDLGIPAQSGRKLIAARICYIDQLLTQSPAGLVREAKLPLLDLGEIEDCIAKFMEGQPQEAEPEEVPVEAVVEEPEVPEAPAEAVAEEPEVPAAPEKQADPTAEQPAEAPAPEGGETLAQLYGLSPEQFRERPVTELELSVRLSNLFRRNTINTLADLLCMTPEDLWEWRGFGKTSMAEVEKIMTGLQSGGVQTAPASSGQSQSEPAFLQDHTDQIINGDFSFAQTAAAQAAAAVYREAQAALGPELAGACVHTPGTVQPIISAFSRFHRDTARERELLRNVPALRRGNLAWGYIRAYTQNEEQRQALREIYGTEDAVLSAVVNIPLDDAQYVLVSRFLDWCAYDLPSQIEALLRTVYKKERTEDVIRKRARKVTLEAIGNEMGVTRERVRQIELKAKKTFQNRQGHVKIISKIAADLNGANVVRPEDLVDYCADRLDEVLYLLRSCESANFTYDADLDLFVLGDDSLHDRVVSFVESLPELFPAAKYQEYLRKAEEEYDLTGEIAQKAVLDVYRLTGDVYHRNRLSLGAIYQEILASDYPDGIHIHDPAELAGFRDRIRRKYGEIGLPENDRALAARIAGVGILCGKGRYRIKQKRYIPRGLEKQIYNYIESADQLIFMTNTVFHVFEDELRRHGIDNKYYLQGVLRELFGEDFIFSRDYISKDPSYTTIHSSIVGRIKKSPHPVSKKQLQQLFPGVPELLLNVATSDPEILQYLGEYLHASRLVLSEPEKQYLRRVVTGIMSDGQPHHSSEFYETVLREKPEIMTRNSVLFQYRCFSILEYLFRGQYEFSRPYIAPLGTRIERPLEQLREFVYGCDKVTLTEISDFAGDIRYKIPVILNLINGCNDRFLLVSNETLMTIEDTGVNEAVARQVEDLVCGAITGTAVIRDLPCWTHLPPVNVPWTEWLVYSILNKWATRVEVAPSHPQYRMAIPLVAPRGKMDAAPFAEIYKEMDCTAGTLAVAARVDVDNIDDLLMDLDDDLLEDALWD